MSSPDPEVRELLGRIDGKLDQVAKTLDRHIDDDVRRFSDTYTKLGEHDKEIAKAQGAKGVILWLAGGGALAISALVSFLVKSTGG